MGLFKSKSSTAAEDNSDEYQIKTGLALLLWNDEGDLEGAPKNDIATIKKLLSNFDIEVLKEDGNLTISDVAKLAGEAVEKLKKKKYDIFVCAMIGHGREIRDDQYVRHQIQFKDQYFCSDVILGFFNENDIPSLKGIPRIFFIDACRSSPDKNPYVETMDMKISTNKKIINEEETKCDDTTSSSSNTDKTTQDDVETYNVVSRDASNTSASSPTPPDHPVKMRSGLSSNASPPEEETKYDDTNSSSPNTDKTTQDDVESSNVVSSDATKTPESSPTPLDQPVKMRSTQCSKDTLVMFASPPGKSSLQVKESGHHYGIMAYGLKKAFERFSKQDSQIDLMDTLTYAGFVMANSFRLKPDLLNKEEVERFEVKNDCASVSCIEHRLTKNIVLNLKG